MDERIMQQIAIVIDLTLDNDVQNINQAFGPPKRQYMLADQNIRFVCEDV